VNGYAKAVVLNIFCPISVVIFQKHNATYSDSYHDFNEEQQNTFTAKMAPRFFKIYSDSSNITPPEVLYQVHQNTVTPTKTCHAPH